MANLRRFLLYFAQEFVDFRYPEIRSLVKLFNLDIQLPQVTDRPYWILENVAEKDMLKIASRSVSLKYIIELWGNGSTYETFHENLKKHNFNPEEPFLTASFRFTVETYNKHIKHSDKIERIESVDYLPFKGKIDLKNPEHKIIYFEFWGMDANNVPAVPVEIALGRWVS